MNKYLLLFPSLENDGYDYREGKSLTRVDFLESVDDQILKETDWVIYEVTGSSDRDLFVHSGDIDELVEEY